MGAGSPNALDYTKNEMKKVESGNEELKEASH